MSEIEITLETYEGDEFDALVEYQINGSFFAGSLEEPPEYPEIEILKITNIETGAEIDDLDRYADKIEQKIWDYEDNKHFDY